MDPVATALLNILYTPITFCWLQEEDEIEEVRDRRHTVEEEIKEAGEDDEEDEKGKLMTKEEREKGAVALRVYLSYAKACGYLYAVIVLVLAVAAQGRYCCYYRPDVSFHPKNVSGTKGFSTPDLMLQ